MAGQKIFFGFLCVLLITFEFVRPNPLGVCVRNCAQCKRMYGPYFNGEACAKRCIKLKGTLIPDCEDFGSIEPFLKAFEDNNVDY